VNTTGAFDALNRKPWAQRHARSGQSVEWHEWAGLAAIAPVCHSALQIGPSACNYI